jgi:preprotein translocase subunit SecY
MLGMFNMFSGGARPPHGDLRAEHHALHLGLDHHPAAGHGLPALEALKKEGEAGRKSSTSTPAISPWCWPCSRPTASRSAWKAGRRRHRSRLVLPISTVVTLTGGTMFLMWLGEQITSRGIGNGISLIIFAGIVARCPRRSPTCSNSAAPGRAVTGLILS